MTPTTELMALHDSTDRLLARVDGLDPAAVGLASRLPDWTVGHLLTHLARNADGNVRMIEGAARGQVLDQYAHGREGRAADIESGAARPAEVIIADVRHSAAALADALEAMPDDAWARPVRSFGGEYPAHHVPVARRREVEFHLVDLGMGYAPTDWPADLVDRELAEAVRHLPERLPAGTQLEVITSDTGVGWSVGEGPSTMVVRGPAPWVLAWLVGRDVPDGTLTMPTGRPRLAPW